MRALYWKCRARLNYWLARRLMKWEWFVRQPALWRWMEGQFARLAALGDVAAQDFYGHILLFRGQGLAAKEEGMRLLRLAAERGSGKAAFQLGVQALKGGLGQVPNAAKARAYWEAAAQAGHPLAAVELVRLLESGGPGLSPDPQRAAELAARFSIKSPC